MIFSAHFDWWLMNYSVVCMVLLCFVLLMSSVYTTLERISWHAVFFRHFPNLGSEIDTEWWPVQSAGEGLVHLLCKRLKHDMRTVPWITQNWLDSAKLREIMDFVMLESDQFLHCSQILWDSHQSIQNWSLSITAVASVVADVTILRDVSDLSFVAQVYRVYTDLQDEVILVWQTSDRLLTDFWQTLDRPGRTRWMQNDAEWHRQPELGQDEDWKVMTSSPRQTWEIRTQESNETKSSRELKKIKEHRTKIN
jgi:hypothetical protein